MITSSHLLEAFGQEPFPNGCTGAVSPSSNENSVPRRPCSKLRTCSAIIVAAIASVARQLDECLLRQKRSFAQICETTRKLGKSAKAVLSERVGPATTWLSREFIHRKSVNLPNNTNRAPTDFILNNFSTVKEVLYD